jgi:hypothetical protein
VVSEKAAWIRALRDNSRLDTPEAVRAFDEALEHISGDLNPADLPELFAVFRDDTHDEEVMYGLVHLVEDFPLDDFLVGFLDAVAGMARNAPEWARTFHYRILNSEKARLATKRLLPERGPSVRSTVEGILRDIAATEGPPLAERAQEVLS